MKKIFIPFDPYVGAIGGPSTFMSHLKRFLDERGFDGYTNDHKGIKAIFFPISYDIELLKKFKKKGIMIIQRLDGVYYPSKHGDAYLSLNKDMKEIHNTLADIVIYQSEYSKSQCETMFGRLEAAESHIILNGADKKVFYPASEVKKELNEVRLVTTGNFRNADMIEPVVKALDLLKQELRFKLLAIGPVSNAKIEHFFDRPYLERKETMDKGNIADEIRKADIFIYSHLNPPCPNSVIEAISCGVPVVGFKSGAMEELLYFNKELLANVSDEVFQEYKDFDEHRLAEKILLAVKEFPRFKKTAMDHSHLYPFEKTGKMYMDIFEKVLEEGAGFKWWRPFSMRRLVN